MPNQQTSINFDWLENVFFKRPLNDHEKELLQGLKMYRHRQSERIIEQGAEGGNLFILHAGKVGVEVTKDGVRTPLVDIEEGSVFGEMSFLSGGLTRADVIAKENCVVYVLKKEQFETIMEQQKELAYALFQIMLGASTHSVIDLELRLLPFLRVVSEKVKNIPLFIKLTPVVFVIIYILAFLYISIKDFHYGP
jgi:CRP/FNR family transcriptional regulator, cyclic AMP receptor protein